MIIVVGQLSRDRLAPAGRYETGNRIEVDVRDPDYMHLVAISRLPADELL